MASDTPQLTEKEKEPLRLLLLGHDAKSMALALDLSVHTVNERLRNARRKLGVTSSKEAARLLLEEEGAHPDSLVPKELGDAAAPSAGADRAQAKQGPAHGRRRLFILAGVTLMTLLLAALAMGVIPSPLGHAPASEEVRQEEMQAAARSWLELVDAGNADASYALTSEAFRELNTLETWTRVSASVRTPLGATVSRQLVSVETPPTPQGYTIVKFATRFENREAAMTETVSLVSEGGTWRVAGVFVE